jgi:hypothetical protein
MTTNHRFELLESLLIAMPPNDFLERIDRTLDWQPMGKALQAMYRMRLRQHVFPGVVPQQHASTNLCQVALVTWDKKSKVKSGNGTA